MKTIVVKGSNFSNNDKSLMRQEQMVLDVKIVLVHPSGDTETIITNENTFKICNSDNTDSIIY